MILIAYIRTIYFLHSDEHCYTFYYFYKSYLKPKSYFGVFIILKIINIKNKKKIT